MFIVNLYFKLIFLLKFFRVVCDFSNVEISVVINCVVINFIDVFFKGIDLVFINDGNIIVIKVSISYLCIKYVWLFLSCFG